MAEPQDSGFQIHNPWLRYPDSEHSAKPMKLDYERVESAIGFLRKHTKEQPGLKDVASHLCLSPFHFQRLFRRWAGVTPKQYLEHLTVNHAKYLLRQSKSVLETTYEIGLSSSARLHDHFVSLQGITPGEYKSRGKGLEIIYGVHPSPFGTMLLALTERGICGLSFVEDKTLQSEITSLQRIWCDAVIQEGAKHTRAVAKSLFDMPRHKAIGLHLVTRGTNFQINVWKALLKLPFGSRISYQQLAEMITKPTAARAVASAVAANPIGYLIPCHRALRNTGELGGYRWGVERKQIMLAWESAKLVGCSNSHDKLCSD